MNTAHGQLPRLQASPHSPGSASSWKSHSPQHRHGPKWCAAGHVASLQPCYPVAGILAAKSHLTRSHLSTLVTHQEAEGVPVTSAQHGTAMTSNSRPVLPAGQGPPDTITQGERPPAVLYPPCCLPSADPHTHAMPNPSELHSQDWAPQMRLHLDGKTLTWLILCPT